MAARDAAIALWHPPSYREGNHGARSMLRRLLNIAAIVCLVLCVALMGMWVRSYQGMDGLSGRYWVTRGFMVQSLPGRLFFGEFYEPESRQGSWTVGTEPIQLAFDERAWQQSSRQLGFDVHGSWPTSAFLVLPLWFVVLMSGATAMVCQLRWPPQFTLRSLFIVTTFLAVVLGMIASLDRAWIGK
jgi:hypothetical protein